MFVFEFTGDRDRFRKLLEYYLIETISSIRINLDPSISKLFANLATSAAIFDGFRDIGHTGDTESLDFLVCSFFLQGTDPWIALVFGNTQFCFS